MKCISCGAQTLLGTTTDVTDLGTYLIVIRNVPCRKCSECNEIIYTFDVVKHLESITANKKMSLNEITIVDYKVA
jgi:YgiT-type zinc finger domain-containing protein